jgi:O-antigen biosynthesis protein WbqP
MYKVFFKRLIDTMLSLLGRIVLFVPMIIIAIIIKNDSPGPILFKQKRLTNDGAVFIMYKFRTMVLGGAILKK